MQRHGDTGAAHPQHHGQKFMGQRHGIGVHAVMRHQQPARQPLFQLGAAIGQGGMGGLDHEGLGRFQHQRGQAGAFAQCLGKGTRRHAIAVAGDLHIAGMLGSGVAHDQRHPGHAFLANDADLDAMIVGIDSHNGHHADFDKIDMGDGLAGDFDDLALFEVDWLQMRRDQIPILWPHLGEQMIAQAVARHGHVIHGECCGLRHGRLPLYCFLRATPESPPPLR